MSKRYAYIVTTLLVGALVSSCGIYGSYSRPQQISTERLFRHPTLPNDTLRSDDTTSIASLPWKEYFSDPYLHNLIAEGLERNADLRVAELSIEQAQAALLSAKLGFLPNISTSPQGQYNYNSNQWSYQLPIVASWEIDLFGKLRNSLEKQKAQTRMVEAQLLLVQTNLIANIANTYYTLLVLDEQITLSKQTIEVWKENLRVLRLLKETGQVTEAAIAQAEGQSFGLEEMLATLYSQQRATENALSLLLHRPPMQIPRGKLGTTNLSYDTNVGLPIQLLANRPDVRIAEENLVMAYYGANRARADFLPSVSLTATGAWTNAMGNVIVDPFTFIGNAVGSLFQPIFNNGRNVAQLRIAKATQEQATIQLQQTLLSAGAEVSNQLYNIQAYRTKLEYREKQLNSLQRATSMSRQLMSLGTGTYLEVLTAQQQLLNAQLSKCNDQLGLVQAHINLYKALGGGVH